MVDNRRARSTRRCTHRPRRLCANGADFRELRALAAFDRKTAAAVLGVTERTIRNWEASRSRVPYSALELLRVLGCYGLPGAAWSGWSLRGDALWSPEQRSFRPHEMAWWGLTVAMARSWKQWRDTQVAIQPGAFDPVPPSHVVAQVTITAGDLDGSLLPSIDKSAVALARSSHEPAAQAGARGPRHQQTGFGGGIEPSAYARQVGASAGRGGEREPVQPGQSIQGGQAAAGSQARRDLAGIVSCAVVGTPTKSKGAGLAQARSAAASPAPLYLCIGHISQNDQE